MRVDIEFRILATLIHIPHERYIIEERNLKDEDFSNQNAKRVYQLITENLNKGLSIDLKTLLAKDESIKSVATKLVQVSDDIKSDVFVIKDEKGRDDLYKISNNIITKVLDKTDSTDIAHDIIKELELVVDEVSPYDNDTPQEVALKTIKMNEENAKRGYTGILTGFDGIDKHSHGFRPNDLTVLASGTGEGKTTFSLNCAVNIAQNGLPTLYWTVEMSKYQMWNKIFGMYLEEPYHQIEEGKADFSKIPFNVLEMPLYVEGGAGLTINEVISTSKRLIRKHGVGMVFVDHLQVLNPGMRKNTTREEDFGYMSGKCKDLALEMGIPVVLVSQLNRGHADYKRYEKHHLKGSGKIEQDADDIYFIYRPAVHDETVFQSFSGRQIECEFTQSVIYRSKSRFGELFETKLDFDTTYGKFYEPKDIF